MRCVRAPVRCVEAGWREPHKHTEGVNTLVLAKIRKKGGSDNGGSQSDASCPESREEYVAHPPCARPLCVSAWGAWEATRLRAARRNGSSMPGLTCRRARAARIARPCPLPPARKKVPLSSRSRSSRAQRRPSKKRATRCFARPKLATKDARGCARSC